MTDEQIKTSSEDEYQFPQEEYASGAAEGDAGAEPKEGAASTGAGASLSARSKLFENYRTTTVSSRTKRILIVVGLLIVIVIVIHFMRSVKPPVIPSMAQKTAQKQQESQSVVQPQAAPMPAVQQIEPQQPVDINPSGSLDEMRAYSSQSDSKIQELQTEVANVQNSLTQSEATNTQLQKSVSALTTQVQALSVQLKQTMEQEKKAPKTKKVVFYLRAVVPDRAWVMTSSGETVSVSVGDSLDQYGTIQSIDPVYGVIETSSGRKITYGQNDY